MLSRKASCEDLLFRSHPWFSQVRKAHYGCVNALSFSHDWRFLASGSDDTRVLLWDLFSPTFSPPVLALYGHHLNIFCATFSQDDHTLLSCGLDDLIQVYDLGKPLTAVIVGGMNRSSSHARDPSSSVVLPLHTLSDHTSAVHRVSFLSNSNFVFLSASMDRTVVCHAVLIFLFSASMPFTLLSLDANHSSCTQSFLLCDCVSLFVFVQLLLACLLLHFFVVVCSACGICDVHAFVKEFHIQPSRSIQFHVLLSTLPII